MEIYDHQGEGFQVMMQFESWRIGMLRSSERFSFLTAMERHNETDEAFILLEGNAVLYEEDTAYQMEKCKIYNVKKGKWHEIVMEKDTAVIVVENSNTGTANSDKRKVISTN